MQREITPGTMKKDVIRNVNTLDELLEIKYGKVGCPKRDAYEAKANNFVRL